MSVSTAVRWNPLTCERIELVGQVPLLFKFATHASSVDTSAQFSGLLAFWGRRIAVAIQARGPP